MVEEPVNAKHIKSIHKVNVKKRLKNKTFKSGAGLAKSPTKRVGIQSNHVFVSILCCILITFTQMP